MTNGLNSSPNYGLGVINGLQGVLRWCVKLVLGALAVLAAGILAIAAAMIGVLIASAIVLFRLTPQSKQARKAHAGSEDRSKDGVVLEASKTGRGWTVE